MCTVIGIKLNFKPSIQKEIIDKVKALIWEASIRGRQATGIAYWDGNKVKSFKNNVSSHAFLKRMNFEKIIYNENEISSVIHTRYATTFGGLGEAQPIVKNDIAVVLNGVITQESPEKWYQLYGVEPETGNDTEIALEYYRQNKLSQLPGSWALVVLKKNEVYGMRNKYRPLWKLEIDREDIKGFIYCSTQNILYRSGWTTLGKLNRISVDFDLIPEEYKMSDVKKLEDYYGEN